MVKGPTAGTPPIARVTPLLLLTATWTMKWHNVILFPSSWRGSQQLNDPIRNLWHSPANDIEENNELAQTSTE